jgi:hypothetical protein
MTVHPAIVITCDGYECTEKLALIGPNAVSYLGARGHALAFGWTTNDEVDWCPSCSAAQAALDPLGKSVLSHANRTMSGRWRSI